MNSDEVIEFEDRSYVNPQTSIDEQNQFIEKFRALQGQNQAQINQQTQALGSQVPSSQGGLVGAENLWNVQYQRPQVNAAIENLRANNQLQALNTVMSNQQNAMANRLNQAKRAYYRVPQEAAKRNRTSGSGGGTTGKTPEGDVEYKISETVLANLQDVPKNNKFYEIATGTDYIPGYATGVSAVTGNTEAERRLKWIAQIISNQIKGK